MEIYMNFVKGMDLSTLAELEKCGAKYYDNGEEKDLLEIMKSYDVDTIRIRVWNDPWSETGESYGAGENDPKTSLLLAADFFDLSLKDAGLRFDEKLHRFTVLQQPTRETGTPAKKRIHGRGKNDKPKKPER